MFPVLFSIGGVSVSSFGVFLALGFLLGIFLIWRLSRAWDLDEERVLDLILLTFIGGLIGARIYFVLENPEYFASVPFNIILINKTPGFSFWGGILGSWLTLFFLAKRLRMNFWQLADIAVVGLLGGLILSDIGCFLGSCSIGILSKSFFAVTMVGFLGKRWPVQAVEAVILCLSLFRIWSMAVHFHERGKIAGLGLIYIGAVKLILEPLKQNHSEAIFSGVFIFLGLTVYYRVTKQSPVKHLRGLVKFLSDFITSSEARKKGVQNLAKSWYNQKTAVSWKIRNLKKLLRRSHAKFS